MADPDDSDEAFHARIEQAVALAPKDALGTAEIHRLACSVVDGTATKDEAERLLREFVRQAERPKAVDERLIEHVRDCFAAYLSRKRDQWAYGLPDTEKARKAYREALEPYREPVKAYEEAQKAYTEARKAHQAGRMTDEEWRKVVPPEPIEGIEPITRMVRVGTLDQAFGLTRAKRGLPALSDDVLKDAAADFLEARLAGRSDDEARAVVARSRWEALLPVSSESHVAQAWTDHKRDALELVGIRRSLRGERWPGDDMARLRELYSGVAGILFPADGHPK